MENLKSHIFQLITGKYKLSWISTCSNHSVEINELKPGCYRNAFFFLTQKGQLCLGGMLWKIMFLYLGVSVQYYEAAWLTLQVNHLTGALCHASTLKNNERLRICCIVLSWQNYKRYFLFKICIGYLTEIPKSDSQKRLVLKD